MKGAAPSPMRRFWRSVPIRSYLLFLTGVFCLFSTLGFINDIESVGGSSAGALALDVLLAGLAAVAWAVTGTKTPGFVVVAVPLHVIAIIGPEWRGAPATPFADRSETEIRQRMEIVATGTAVGVLLGYGCFIVFVATEGRRYLRTQTESCWPESYSKPSRRQSIGAWSGSHSLERRCRAARSAAISSTS